MIRSYPTMHGTYAPDEFLEDDSILAGYSIGKSVIYAAFARSKAEAAYNATFALAAKHGVGFYDVGSDAGEVWLPDGKGGLSMANSAA